MGNEFFQNNNIEHFLNSCKGRRLVMLGTRDEVDFMRWNFLKQLEIDCENIYYADTPDEIATQIEKIRIVVDPKTTIIIIASDYPFLTRRLLKEAGLSLWYCTQLFMERYCFYNNTNICHFYLKE